MTLERLADELGSRQRRLMQRASDFLRAESNRGVDVGISPECYLNCWADVPGKARLRRLAGGSGSEVPLLRSRIREAVLVAGQSGYEVVSRPGDKQRLTRLAISWCRGGDFASDGEYSDRYFRSSSRASPRTLWFLIALDDCVPQQFDANILILHRKPGTPRLDYLYLLRSALNLLKRKRFGPYGKVPLLSAAVSFANQVAEAVCDQLKLGAFESIVMPYEAQPFQHAVFRAAKSHNRAIRTVGYLHSALPPLPTDLLHRSGAPELLLVHGRGQADILVRYLGWPEHAIRRVASLRYRARDDAPLHGYIFLPYSFADGHVIESAFHEYLAGSPVGSLPTLVVRNHPLMQRSQTHLQLKFRMEESMRIFSDRFATAPLARRLSVFVGATAAILEALERGVEAVQICSQVLLESHSAAVWNDLDVERLGTHVFRYQLVVPGTYIQFGDENDSIDAYLGPPVDLQRSI